MINWKYMISAISNIIFTFSDIHPLKRPARLSIIVFILIFHVCLFLPVHAHSSKGDIVRIILFGHTYGFNDQPSPGFLNAIDTLATFDADAIIVGGDITHDGTALQWNILFQSFENIWDFPFIPIIGNHDAINRAEWQARFGLPYYTYDLKTTRLIALDTVERPNSSLSDEQLEWFLAELTAAEEDPGVENVIIGLHKLLWIKAHPRYERMYELGNAWYADFETRGYDVNPFFEEIWSSIVHLGKLKPTVVFAGDTGYTTGNPGLFYDILDGVTLIACGTSARGVVENDAAILYTAVGDKISFQSISLWGVSLDPVEQYNVNYWNEYYDAEPTPPTTTEKGPENLDFVLLLEGTFEMGDHIDPINEIYLQTTGYTVTLSPFIMASKEVAVSQYVAFLNTVDINEYEGVECIDLDDPECQIEYVSGVFKAKSSEMTNLPVVEVTWYGALAFCNYLSQHDGLEECYVGTEWVQKKNGWRLPTEAEFEYAIRGGEGCTEENNTYYRFFWSDNSADHVHDHANYYGTGGVDTWHGLSPVASFAPNQFGIYDLSGNAFEWVFDPWTWPTYLKGAVEDPIGEGSWNYPEWRTIRGGGFNFHWQACRNGYRSSEHKAKAHSYIGFRIARNGNDTTISINPQQDIPDRFQLFPAYPNPFSRKTILSYQLLEEKFTQIIAYNSLGQKIKTLFAGYVTKNDIHKVSWNGYDDAGRPLPGGLYFFRLIVGNRFTTRKVLLLR